MILYDDLNAYMYIRILEETQKMLKEQVLIYKNRWKLVAEVENREIREAPAELLLKQTFSIWKIASSLGFFDQQDQPNRLWARLQKKWITHNV